jgi:hypothetical protein
MPGGGPGKDRRVFFFEKKKQKPFVTLAKRPPHRLPQESKVFCFFSSEKKTFPSRLAPWPQTLTSSPTLEGADPS